MGAIIHRHSRVVLTIVLFSSIMVCRAAHPPALFIFGDSTVAAGNDYYDGSFWKPRYPYGVDFKGGSPRTTNGKTFIDVIGEELGVKGFIPPVLAPSSSGSVILRGLNYASMEAAIFDHSPEEFGNRLNLDAQIKYFEKTRQSVLSQLETQDAKLLFEEAVFFISIGTNDIHAWEGIKRYGTWATYNVYLHALTTKFRSQLKRLHQMGARKVVVTNCGPLGCTPDEREAHQTIGSCVTFLNNQARSYNKRLKRLLAELASTLEGFAVVEADIYASSKDILQNYKSYGFANKDTACCGNGETYRPGERCGFLATFCPNRSEYVFWDGTHFTEKGNTILAKHLLSGGSNYISPVNIKQLINHTVPL